MRLKKFCSLVFILALTCIPVLSNADSTTQHRQVQDAISAIKKLQNVATNTTDNTVYLGDSEISNQQLNTQYQSTLTQLLYILNRMDHNNPKNITTLHWIPITTHQLLSEKNTQSFFNAGSDDNPIYICRAFFVGTHGAVSQYPGQLVSDGCRISYAGYAFVVSKFDVLSGQDKKLHWIAIEKINQLQQTQLKTKPKTHYLKNELLASGTWIAQHQINSSTSKVVATNQSMPFYFSIQIEGALPVSGGYDNNLPVAICRATHNNRYVIGKLVFFMANDHGYYQQEKGCDIGVENKEITVMHDYELLYAQVT